MTSVMVEKAKRLCHCLGVRALGIHSHEIKKGEWRLTIVEWKTQGFLCKDCIEKILEKMK